MTGRRRILAFCALLLLAGCAQQPPAPSPREAFSPPAPAPVAADDRRAQAIARHQRLAQGYRNTGDHAAAEAQWQILILLDPDTAAWTRELAATRETIRSQSAEQLRIGQSALAAGDLTRASQALLRVLALEPGQAEAARLLREIDRRRASRVQADRAARVRAAGVKAETTANGNPAGDGYRDEIDHALELLNAGETEAGLRELRAYVDTHPGSRAERARIAGAVAERAGELESKGEREAALGLYAQATSLGGSGAAPWAPRARALGKSLSQEYYEQGSKAFRSDLALAIRLLEKSVALDPANSRAATRLKEARTARSKLDSIEKGATAGQ